MSNNIRYCSLHCHSMYSLGDALCTPEQLVERAKEIGMPAIAVTDHGVVSSFIKMHKACKKEGIKFIPGMEAYFTHDHEEKIQKSYHLTVLAMNNRGLQNLYKLVTMANFPVGDGGGFYYRPRISWKDIEKYNEGLIVLSGCMASPINREFGDNEDYEEGLKHAKRFMKIMGSDRFFIELQYVNEEDVKYIPEHEKILEFSRKAALELGLECVATNDTHYVRKTDSFLHEVWKCIDAKGTLETPIVDPSKGVTRGRIVFNGYDYHLKSTKEMLEKFTEEEVAMSENIANMCNVDFNLHADHMPNFQEGMSQAEAFEKLKEECRNGWVSRKINSLPNKKEYAERAKKELADIEDANLSNYFLIVWDTMRFCHESQMPVGRGRGSAAGSLISYLLNITQVDPIKHGLIWERFWNAGRKGAMPDIDLDISIKRRGEVVDYLREKFGRDRVFPMMTISTLSVKAALKDVGKALCLPFAYVNHLTSLVPKHGSKTIEDTLKNSPVLKKMATSGTDSEVEAWQKSIKMLENEDDSEAEILALNRKISDRKKTLKQLFKMARQLEGTARQRSGHACAILIFDKPVFGRIPLCWDAPNKRMVTGFDMYDLEDLGCLKLDILGLKTLDVCAESHPDGVDAVQDWDDKKVFDLISAGQTKGVFQLESPLGRQWCKKMRPRKLSEISDLVALIRPAVLETGLASTYLKNREQECFECAHPDLEPLFKNTHGIMLYQEQMIELVKEIAGFTLQGADKVRKACGKKLPEEMAKYKDAFIEGCVEKGYNEELGEELWTWIEASAGYSFNASHSMSYGELGYITAWMKVYRTPEFFLSLFRFSKDEQDTQKEILELFYDAKLFGISVRPPSLKMANVDFELSEDKKQIFFGLGHIKHVGDKSIGALLKIKDMRWKDILLNRKVLKIKKNVLMALILSGALDYLKIPRNNMKKQLEFVAGDKKKFTDRELTIIEHIMFGTEAKFGKKEVEIDRADNFVDAIKNFVDWLQNTNETQKIINKRRAPIILEMCEDFLNDYDPKEKMTIKEKAGYESYFLSVPVTCSEIDIYDDSRRTHHLIEVEKEFDNVGVTAIGIINKVNHRKTRQGKPMAFIGLQDSTYQLDAAIFSPVCEKYADLLEEGKVILVEGKKRRGSIVINRIEAL